LLLVVVHSDDTLANIDMPPPASQSPIDNKQKKPRHRHSPNQIAALNEVYEKDEHPDLAVRTSLAASLGMYVDESSLSYTTALTIIMLILVPVRLI